MKCVVLAGGAGLRLWPLSRKNFPKQFLELEEGKTLFAETIDRNSRLCDDFLIITNDAYRFTAEKELVGKDRVNCKLIFETVGKNTAPAIAMASMLSDKDEILFVVSSDAYIKGKKEYTDAVNQAKKLAEAGYIVTFGIKLTEANTEYGYINYSGNDVIEFKEKPDKETALKYIENGGYLWNSGMFMFKSSVLLDELKKYRPDIYDSCLNVVENMKKRNSTTMSKELMNEIPSESIDYAVMEKSDKVKVVPAEFHWSDVGGLEAASEIINRADEGNSYKGRNIIINNCENTSVINDSNNSLVVVNDVKDIIVTNTNNAVYVSKKGSSKDIKQIINNNQEKYSEFFNENIYSYRPWGYYEVLESTAFYKVKSIVVYPGKRLSLQKHNFRSEHWVVVKGTAYVTVGNESKECHINESVDIPIGEIHRLANNTDKPLEIIEIATGKNISEEDIIRLEDDFGREE